MTTKRIIGMVAIVVLVVIIGFILILYATIKTKSTSLNKYAPYKEWIGKTVMLDKETILFKENIRMNSNSGYLYTLLDSLHPQWQYKDKQTEIGDMEKIIHFPAGTALKLEKAIQYTNGVSGSSYPTMFGTIIFHGKEYKIAYQWGEIDIGKRFDKIEKCWRFHQAPWQTAADTNFYALPIANVW